MSQMIKLNNKLAFCIILLSFAFFAFSNTATRYITHINAIPISVYFVYVKFFAVVLLAIIGIFSFGNIFFTASNKKFVAIRCLVLTINNICLTVSLKFLALDIFYAIVFIMPLLTTLLSFWMLQEKFTRYNIFAIIVGFIGVIIIIQPTMGDSLKILGVTCAIITAITGSLSAIIARKYLAEENPYTATFYVACCAFILGFLMTIGDGNAEIFSTYINLQVSAIIFLSALFTILASSLYMRAYQLAGAKVIAQAQYTQLLWGVLFGYLLFDEHTTQSTMIGCIIIIFATIVNYYASIIDKQHK